MTQITIYQNPQKLTQAAAQLFIETAQDSISKRGRFSAALSGGSTPKPIYRELANPEHQPDLDWANIHLFWGDERHVPPTHPDSNFRLVQEQLLLSVTIPEENIHRVPAESEIRMAAFQYEEELRLHFMGEWPRFDLIFLGMGEDGHTASLFPGSAGLNEECRWFIANFAPKQKVWRLTLTKNAINAARHIAVVVQGDSKAPMLAEVLTSQEKQKTKPIQLISPNDGDMIWLVDQKCARLLPDTLVE